MSMEAVWVAHLEDLADRVRRNDPSLVHLEPYPRPTSSSQPTTTTVQPSPTVAAETEEDGDQKQPARAQTAAANTNPSRSALAGSASRMWSLFHMMILLDDRTVQEALERLWVACRGLQNDAEHAEAAEGGGLSSSREQESEIEEPKTAPSPPRTNSNNKNTHVRCVTLPCIWPCSDLRQALAACTHLEGLQELYISPENSERNSDKLLEDDGVDAYEDASGEPVIRPVASAASTTPMMWHASPLELGTDLFPVLRAVVGRMQQQQQLQQRRSRSESASTTSSWSSTTTDVASTASAPDWSSTPLLLAPAAVAVPSLSSAPPSPYRYPGLVHLELESRLLARSQADLDEFGRLLARLTYLQTLVLHLVPFEQPAPAAAAAAEEEEDENAQTTSTTTIISLDPILLAAAELSHPSMVDAAASIRGLESLTLQWGDETTSSTAAAVATTPAVSVEALARLLDSGSSSSTGNLDDILSATTSTLHTLRLDHCRLTDRHLQQAVAVALAQPECALRRLHLAGHAVGGGSGTSDDGVSLAGLRAIRNVLESHNYTLQHISLYTPDEEDHRQSSLGGGSAAAAATHRAHSATRRLLAVIRRRLASHGLEEDEDTSYIDLTGNNRSSNDRTDTDDDDDDDDEEEYYRLQHQLEIYCRLNRLGRGALLSPRTSADEWIETLAQCCSVGGTVGGGGGGADDSDTNNSPWMTTSFGTIDAAAAAAAAVPPPPLMMSRSSGLVRRADGLVDVGLNEIFILLRTHPSLCHIDGESSRRALHPLGSSSNSRAAVTTSSSAAAAARATTTSLPLLGLSQQERANSFKNLVAPPTTINKALAIQWRKKRKKKRQQRQSHGSGSGSPPLPEHHHHHH